MSQTSVDSGGIVNASLGRISWEPTLNNHDDITPGLIPLETAPFTQTDWPNPPIKRPLLITIATRPQEDGVPPFIPKDWRNPDLRKNQPIVFSSQILPNIQPDAQAPFSQSNWPAPRAARRLTVRNISRLVDDANIAFNKTDWPSPLVKTKTALTHLNDNQNNTLVPVTQGPLVQTDWTNPQYKKKLNPDWTQSRPQYYTDLTPNNQYDWPNPAPFKLKSQTWVQNLLETTLFTAPVQPPTVNQFAQVPRKGGLIVGISTSINPTPPEQPPFSYAEIPDFIRKRQRAVTDWTQNRQFYYTDIKPFKQDDYRNPDIRKVGPNTWIFSRKIDEPAVQNPNIPTNLNNPRLRGKIPQDWAFSALYQQLDVRPISTPLVAPTILKSKFTVPSILQARPSYYTEPSLTSLTRQRDWPNPPAKRKLNPNWDDFYTIDPSAAPPESKPSTRYVVLIPGKRPIRSYMGHIDYRTFDTNLPTQPLNVINTIVPRKSAIGQQTWINNSLTATSIVSMPPGRQIYNNVIGKKRPVFDWLSDSLAVSDVPFSQYSYPNPRVVKYALTHIQNRPFFYEEAIPLLINNDFPNPSLRKANLVGFVATAQLTENTPFVPYDLSIPVRGKRLAETYLVNLLQSTLTPAAPDIPFIPIDWSNPRTPRHLFVRTVSRFVDDIKFPLTNDEFSNPRVKPRLRPGWIWCQTLTREDPTSSVITLIPGRKDRPTLSWINNLQQSSLNPLPFTSQTQKDWPNPKIGRRNQVGFGYGIVQLVGANEVPFVPVLFNNPALIKSGKGFDYNTLSILTSVEGNLPFAQYNWPVFRRINRNGVDYLQGMGIVLPQIIGRPICLLSEAAEYYLISQADDYDLESQRTEYYLDTDGHSCQ